MSVIFVVPYSTCTLICYQLCFAFHLIEGESIATNCAQIPTATEKILMENPITLRLTWEIDPNISLQPLGQRGMNT